MVCLQVKAIAFGWFSKDGYITVIWFSLRKQAGYMLGKKALKAGYKRYGIPGAIVTGSAAALGYVVVRRALKSSTGRENVDSAINADHIKSTISEKGLSAVTERGTLESAINEDELSTSIDIEDVQSEAEEETENLDEGTGADDAE